MHVLKKVLTYLLVWMGIFFGIIVLILAYGKISTDHEEINKSLNETYSLSEVYVQNNSLFITGEIDSRTPTLVKHALSENPDVDLVRLKSVGGSGDAALVIAKMVMERELNTFATEYCNSACTLIFVSGKTRAVSASTTMGFHAPGWKINEASYTASDVSEFVASANHFSGKMIAHYINRGVPVSLVQKIMGTRFENVLYLSGSELITNKIANLMI